MSTYTLQRGATKPGQDGEQGNGSRASLCGSRIPARGAPLGHVPCVLIAFTLPQDVQTADMPVVPRTAFQHYVVVKDTSRVRKIENKDDLPWTAYLGVLGMAGMTAHHGWEEFVRPRVKKVSLCNHFIGSP